MIYKTIIGLILTTILAVFNWYYFTTEKNINDQYTTFIIQNANIISMQSDSVLIEKDILILNGTIQRIADKIEPRSDAEIIDGSGKYLMPALFDMHAHIGVENPFLAYQLGLYRYFGIHNVNLMTSNDQILSIKSSISGKFNGALKTPHLHLASELVDGDPPLWGDQHNGPILNNVNAVESALRELKEKGYQDIKVYDQLSEEVYLKILKVSQHMGLRVVGHVPTSLSLDNRLDVRQQRIDHLYGFLELAYDGDISELPGMSMERLKALIDGFNSDKFTMAAENAAEKNIWVVPTHVLYSALLDQEYVTEIMSGEYSQWLDPTLQGWWTAIVSDEDQMSHMRSEKFRDIHRYMITGLNEAGVRLMAGTDAPLPLLMYGRSLHKELELFKTAGLSPYESLKTATVHPAEYLGLEDIGVIAEGFRAEFILLDKNPLEEITNTLSITGYFSGHTYMNRTDMEKYLSKVIE